MAARGSSSIAACCIRSTSGPSRITTAPTTRSATEARPNLDEVTVAVETAPEELLLVDEALDKLEAQDPDKARLVKLRFFSGLTNEEAAAALDISPTTAKRLVFIRG